MYNTWTIFRRELAAYYTSAIGYLVVIVFLILSVGLFIIPFFTILSADMRAFFTTLPILLCMFLPAITMRLWAEERKQNTWEMLLTFPMRPHELVLGKFGASLTFFLSALLGTLTVPCMLIWLGNPDPGPILGAYLGTLLLGAFFLALGLFVSGLCQEQIVAFVVTLLICFAVFLLGTGFLSTYIDAAWPGLGWFLAETVGMSRHYATFTRGVIAVGDVLYFVIWTIICLFLNGLFLEIRRRPAARRTFLAAVALCLGIGLMLNWLLIDQRLGRFDLTQDKIYTLSDASIKILRSLQAPAQIRLYLTPRDKMPTEMRYLERDLLDKLHEMRLASNGNILPRAIHMETTPVIQPATGAAEAQGNAEDAIEKRLLDKGIRPFSVQALREDEVVNKLVYAAIGIGYKDKEEEILPRILPSDLDTLEYRLVNTLYKLNRNTPPVVALVAPKEPVDLPPYMRQLYQQMGRALPQPEDPYEALERLLRLEQYAVRRVELSPTSGLPADASLIVVLNPRHFSERQRWELNRALHAGKPILLAVQMHRWIYQVVRKAVSITKQEEHPEINPWLQHYGIKIDNRILMDVNHQSLTVRQANDPLLATLGSGVTLNLPLHITVPQDAMNRDVSITSRLSSLFYLWGSALVLDTKMLAQHGLQATVLLTSSPKAWTIPGDAQLSADSLQVPAAGGQRYPLAILIQGQFPDVYQHQARPAWPDASVPPEGPVPPPSDDVPGMPSEPAPGKLLVIGNAQMFHRHFLTDGNLDFFINSVDALTLGDDLINVRNKKRIHRSISRPSPATRQLWKFINLGLVNLLIAALGTGSALVRQRARAAYTTSQTVNSLKQST